MGGAIYLEGNSSINIEKTVFQNNYSKKKGGAIYATGFNKLKIIGETKIANNMALE